MDTHRYARTGPSKARLRGDEAQALVGVEGEADHGLVLLRVERAGGVGHRPAGLLCGCGCGDTSFGCCCSSIAFPGGYLNHVRAPCSSYLEEEDGGPEEAPLEGHVPPQLRHLGLVYMYMVSIWLVFVRLFYALVCRRRTQA